MLEVGRVGSTTDGGKTGVPGWSLNATATLTWNRAHFGAWCIVSAPLVLSIDLTKELTKDLIEIIMNAEAIKINQAWAGHPGTFLRNATSAVQVWVKPQPNNAMAILFINPLGTNITANVSLAELNMTASCSVRDVWQRRNVGQAVSVIATSIGPTDSQFLLISNCSSSMVV